MSGTDLALPSGDDIIVPAPLTWRHEEVPGEYHRFIVESPLGAVELQVYPAELASPFGDRLSVQYHSRQPRPGADMRFRDCEVLEGDCYASAEDSGTFEPLVRAGQPQAIIDELVSRYFATTWTMDAAALRPAAPLAAHLDRASLTTDSARQQLYHVLMLDIARIIRAALPDATSIIIDARDHYVHPEGVHLHAILDAAGETLWQRDQQPADALANFRTSGGLTWTTVVSDLGAALEGALGGEDASQCWEPSDDGHVDFYRADLPSSDEVAAAMTVPDGFLAAHLDNRDAGPHSGFWLAAPVPRPTMTVAGVTITASYNPDGGLIVDIDTTRTDLTVMAPAGPDTPIVVRVNAASATPVTATGHSDPGGPDIG